MDRLIDEIVKVSLADATAAAAATSVNTVAVLGVSSQSGAATKVCVSQNEVDTAFGSTSDLAKITKGFFLGLNPGKIVGIPTTAAPTKSTIAGLLDAALALGKDASNRPIDFYHVIIRFPSTADADDIIEMIDGDSSNVGLEEWCETNFKVAHVEIEDRTVAESVLSGMTKNPKRVAIYFHSETNQRSLAAAICGERCSKDPARGTWAHKNLPTLVADATSRSQLADANLNGLNVYCTVAGVDRMFFGTVGTALENETFNFIDSQIKKDWIKFRVQEKIFNLLGDANDGDGVDFNQGGIDAVVTAVTNVLSIAEDKEHRYILPGSSNVDAPLYEDIPDADKGIRNLPYVSGTFSIQESIHTVKTVQLQVVD